MMVKQEIINQNLNYVKIVHYQVIFSFLTLYYFQIINGTECILECPEQFPAFPFTLSSGFASSFSDSGNLVFCGGHRMVIKSERSCQESKLNLDDSYDQNGTWNRSGDNPLIFLHLQTNSKICYCSE